MAPSPNDPVTDAPAPTVSEASEVDPLAELRRAVAAPGEPWPARIRRAAELVRGGTIGRPDRPATMVLFAVAVVVVGISAFVVWRVGVGPAATDAGGGAAASLPRATTLPAPAGPTGTTPGPGAAADLVVQAAGAVVRPGVYHLAAGARVGDLIALAGGFAADADPDRVNLASPLGDGVRVWVPRRGEADPPVPIGGGGAIGGSGGSSSGGTAPAALVDLNSASSDELDALPGIGPATAAAIIDHRQRNGPFRSVEDLAEVRGIGDAKLAQLRDLVRV